MHKYTCFIRTIISCFCIVCCFLESFSQQPLRVGAECTEDYIPYIQDKRVAVVANQTSVVQGVHLVDTLMRLDVPVKKIFCPEHGFRGNADAGEHLQNSIDSISGLPIISLYGTHKKPYAHDLENIDIIVFDIQDVGARFYTYISTMHYIMEACAELSIECMILDRPNPHGFYIDGPILESSYTSFVGMHPVPVVHGMTIGEYARMINGERWLKNGIQCDLTVVLCDGYDHSMRYQLPIPPSPNLPNMQAVYLYPSLCFFEGTVFSCGRGTDFPFQLVGAPEYSDTSFSFMPRSIQGASKNPPHKNKMCYGIDLRTYAIDSLAEKGLLLEIFVQAYEKYPHKTAFFIPFFTTLAGTKSLQKALVSQISVSEIKQSWQHDLQKFNAIRKKYLLYPDFK
ncbi:MAG: DUF1343 domain-containing protein [Bacteroidales bacterium]|nr:DUF1343 domain-containing protein [Bacteroidales bacterium]